MITSTIPWRSVLMDQRGSINLPKPIKAELKLAPGSGVSVAVHQGMLLLVPAILDSVVLTDMATAKLGIPPAPAPVAVAAQPQPVPVPAAAPFHGWSHQNITKFDNRCRMTLDAAMRERLGIHPGTLVLTDVRLDYDGAPVMVIRALTPSVTLQAVNDCRALQAREQAIKDAQAELAEARKQLEADRAALDRREAELNARARAGMFGPKPAPTFAPSREPFSPGWVHTPPAMPETPPAMPETPPVVIPFAKTPAPATPFPAFIFPDAQSTPTSTVCATCNLPQYNTPSGMTCPNGHGGAPSKDKAPTGFLWKNGVLVDDISDGDGKAS